MPSFSFRGFNTGAPVAISVTQGASEASGQVTTWGQGNLGNLLITPQRTTSLVAPAGVYLEATNLSGFNTSTAPVGTDYDPEFHEITFIWTIRGAPLSFETQLNLPSTWNNPNVAYGKEVFFAFSDAGTYDVDLWAVDRYGTTGVATHQIVNADADVVYAGADTICYSETDFIGKPTGATEVASLSALNAAIAARGSGAIIRVLFRGGATIDIGGRIVCGTTASTTFGSFGGGRATVLSPENTNNEDTWALISSPSAEQKFHDLNLLGGWDAVRERGVPADSPVWRDYARDTLFHRCKISGHDSLYTAAGAGDALFAVSDTEITNWRNFGIFGYADNGGDKYFGLSGCAIYQHVDAPQGSFDGNYGDRILSNAHGPIRLEEAKRVYMGVCDFFSRDGWSQALGGTSDQPCVRHNSNGITGVFTVMDRCACEGGYQIIKMRGQDRSTQDVPGNFVFDKLLTVGTPETQFHIECHFGGTTIRNWLAVETDVPKNSYGLSSPMGSFGIDADEITAANQTSPVSIYSSTFLGFLTSANNRAGSVEPGNENLFGVGNGYAISGDADSGFQNFLDENNVEHFPNQNTPVLAEVAIDSTTPIVGFSPRFKGVLESLPAYFATLASDVVHGGTFTLPYSVLLDKDRNPTSQAYWLGRDVDDTQHAIYVPGSGVSYAKNGDLTVSFGASFVTITNTSGTTWSGGGVYTLKLDHSSLKGTIDASHSVAAQVVPVARPQVGVGSAGRVTGGLVAEDAFDASPRPGRFIPGAPSGTPAKGAVEAV